MAIYFREKWNKDQVLMGTGEERNTILRHGTHKKTLFFSENNIFQGIKETGSHWEGFKIEVSAARRFRGSLVGFSLASIGCSNLLILVLCVYSLS